nr:PIN domain-containing protein [Candidatus Sigynarchaeota archaeon]
MFIAAIKDPLKMSSTLQLIVDCIKNSDIELIGNKYIIEEMQKYQDLFASPSASILLSLLIFKTKVIEVDDTNILKCKLYFPAVELFDILHAATALQEDAIIITNDKHFDSIKEQKLIRVWSISEAIFLLPRSPQK